MSPTINASLCAPDTRWISTSGHASTVHTALAGSAPNRRANATTPAATRARPPSAITRSPAIVPASDPPTATAQPATSRNSGPYGAGESHHVVDTASNQGQPNCCTPYAYGSPPAC
jgi:hypothetical protein